MESTYRWETTEPLSTLQEVLNYYIKNINMLDIVRRSPCWFEGVNNRGIHYRITPHTSLLHVIYKHRVDIVEIKS